MLSPAIVTYNLITLHHQASSRTSSEADPGLGVDEISQSPHCKGILEELGYKTRPPMRDSTPISAFDLGLKLGCEADPDWYKPR